MMESSRISQPQIQRNNKRTIRRRLMGDDDYDGLVRIPTAENDLDDVVVVVADNDDYDTNNCEESQNSTSANFKIAIPVTSNSIDDKSDMETVVKEGNNDVFTHKILRDKVANGNNNSPRWTMPLVEDDTTLGRDERRSNVDGLYIMGESRSYSCKGYTFILLVLFYSVAITVVLIAVLLKSSESFSDQPSTVLAMENSNNYYSTLLNTSVPSFKLLPSFTQTLTRIAFGSCSSQEMAQPYWDTIVTTYDPNVFLLMGDNVYADCSSSTIEGNNTTCIELQEAYQRLAAHPSVIGAARRLAILATLDDHDYGLSDCDTTNPYKDIAQEYFLEFFQIPKIYQNTTTSTNSVETTINTLPLGSSQLLDDSNTVTGTNNYDRRKDGVYRAGIWGQDGNAETTIDERVQIILLDTRYMRSPFLGTGNPHSPYTPYMNQNNDTTTNDVGTDGKENTKPQILSQHQWEWLERQFQQPARIRIVVSSIQVLNDSSGFECWRHVPSEREKLYQLIYDTTLKDSSRTIILSGDRHVGAFYEYIYNPSSFDNSSSMNSTTTETTNTMNSNGDGAEDAAVAPQTVTIIEVTSSSLTHSIPYGTFNASCTSALECDEADSTRDGDFIRDNLFGTIDVNFLQDNATSDDPNEDDNPILDVNEKDDNDDNNNKVRTKAIVEISLRRSEDSYGAAYHHFSSNDAVITNTGEKEQPQPQNHHHRTKSGDAGQILQSKMYTFYYS
jgi:alkaline phosphatase D